MLIQSWEKKALPLFLLVVLCLASLYNLTSTPFEAPDEMGHFYYIVHLLRERRLPVIPADYPLPYYEQEGAQAPLYYFGGAVVVRALQILPGMEMPDERLPFTFNPYSQCGQPRPRYNVVALAHDVYAERFPFAGRVRVLHLLRLYSSLLAVGTVAGIFVTARRVFPGRPRVAWLAAAIAAMTPEFLFTAGAVSNDNMVTLLATWSVYTAISIYDEGISMPRLAVLALLSGLTALSKLGGVMLAPFGGVVLCLTAHRRRPAVNLRRYVWQTVGQLALFGGLFVVLVGWIYIRNWLLYGDPTALDALLAAFPGREEPMTWGLFLRELPGLFLSWWGVFGCTFPPIGFYVFCGIVTLGGLVGLVVARRDLPYAHLALLLLWAGLMMIGYIQWNWLIHAAKGRLLYPTMIVVATLLGRGWETWAARWPIVARVLMGALTLVALMIPFSVMSPPVAPPPHYSDGDTVTPQVVVDGQFGDVIALHGYDLNTRSFQPGDTLDLTLYWQALTPPDRHYSLAVQLVSARPGDTTTRLNFNTWPGGGNAPTGFWRPGEVIADRYRLTIPAVDAFPQAWILQIALYDLETGARLPFASTGDAAPLTLVRIGAATKPVLPSETLTAPVVFQGAIRLHAVTLTPVADQLHVTVGWESLASLPVDYTVFVHLLDATGDMLAAADAPPLAGGFPTSLWQPGDVIRDEYVLPLPGGATSAYTVSLGWYDPQTGARLEAIQNVVVLPDAALEIPYNP